MAIGDAYASLPEYKAVKDKSSADDDLAIERTLVAVSRYIDHKLDRPSGFNRDTSGSPTIRTYMPKSRRRNPWAEDWAESENPWLHGPGQTRVLDIEDLVELGVGGSITIDTDRDNTFSTTLATSDYELLPRNAAVGPEAQPYKQIGLTPYGTQFSWPLGARVRVTGIHGWPAVPQSIWYATIEITAMLRVESPFATDRIQEMDQVVNASPQTRSILNGLMTNYHAGIFF